jgi:serine protease
MGLNHFTVKLIGKTRPKVLQFCLGLGLILGTLGACTQPPPVFLGATFLRVSSADVLTPAQPSKDFTIQNPTLSTVAWDLTFAPDPSNPNMGDWFTPSQTQGSLRGGGSTTLALRLNPNLPAGLYTSLLTLRYEGKQESVLIVGQVPGGTTGTAKLSGQITTDNALIPVTNALTPNAQIPQAQTEQARYVPGQLLVKYKESEPTPNQELSTQQLAERQSLTQSLVAEYQLSILEPALPGQATLFGLDPAKSLQDVEAVAKTLSNDPRVEYATPNYYLQALELPNDTNITEQWALSVAGLPVAWQVETGTSNPVTVAVLDTGFDLNHEDLTGRFLPGYDFCATTKPATKTQPKTCDGVDDNPIFGDPINKHGTHVAGLLAASGNNAKGIVGAAYGSNVKILPIKIFDDFGGSASIDTFTKGIRWAVGLEVAGVPKNQHPARIINLSLGGTFLDKDNKVNQSAVKLMQDAVDAADHAGALLIAATGNSSSNFVLSPAAANHVLGIGSVDTTLERSNFSNYSEVKKFGPGTVDLVAPGSGILSTVPNSSYDFLSGTSMSTPLVSGIAALVLSHEPQLSPEALEERLFQSTYFDKSYMNENEYGKGVLRADLAFGLPGPGSKISVVVGSTLTGSTSSALTTTTLDAYGSSDSFTLPTLAAGDYRLIALSNGSGGQLLGGQTLTLQETEDKTLEIIIKK